MYPDSVLAHCQGCKKTKQMWCLKYVCDVSIQNYWCSNPMMYESKMFDANVIQTMSRPTFSVNVVHKISKFKL